MSYKRLTEYFDYGLGLNSDSSKFDKVICDYGADGKVWFNKDFIKGYVSHLRLANRELLKIVARADADGCEGCAFVDTEEWGMPCKRCKRNHKDYWRAKK